MPERGRCFSMGYTTLSGPVEIDEKRSVAVATSSAEEKGDQKDE